jgi:hypothetical protein
MLFPPSTLRVAATCQARLFLRRALSRVESPRAKGAARRPERGSGPAVGNRLVDIAQASALEPIPERPRRNGRRSVLLLRGSRFWPESRLALSDREPFATDNPTLLPPRRFSFAVPEPPPPSRWKPPASAAIAAVAGEHRPGRRSKSRSRSYISGPQRGWRRSPGGLTRCACELALASCGFLSIATRGELDPRLRPPAAMITVDRG